MIKYYLKAFTLYLLFTNEIGGTNRDHNFFQDFWQNVHTEGELATAILKKEQFETALKFSPNAKLQKASNVILKVPLYNGHKKSFKFYESNVLPTPLKAKYLSPNSVNSNL